MICIVLAFEELYKSPLSTHACRATVCLNTRMLLIKDFPLDGIISTASINVITYARIISLSGNTIGVIVDLVIMTALIMQQDVPIDTQFVISLVSADVIFNVLFLVTNVGGVMYDGWWIGKSGKWIVL